MRRQRFRLLLCLLRPLSLKLLLRRRLCRSVGWGSCRRRICDRCSTRLLLPLSLLRRLLTGRVVCRLRHADHRVNRRSRSFSAWGGDHVPCCCLTQIGGWRRLLLLLLLSVDALRLLPRWLLHGLLQASAHPQPHLSQGARPLLQCSKLGAALVSPASYTAKQPPQSKRA